jgi:nucleotidyltransferase substrate binding protein (TIGR01987 family)
LRGKEFLLAVSLIELTKALASLEEALTVEKTDISRDASIQRFEFCVELSWKSAKKVMGTSATAPKQVIREMAQSGLIENVEFWLKSIDQRNLSSHTYNEKLAEEVYAFAESFLQPAKQLLEKLQAQ